jgi:ubiquinone biosynthesis protein UbiJ
MTTLSFGENPRTMAGPSPFPFLDDLFDSAARTLQPPWLVQEMQRRIVLLLNHVLMQEDEAQARLARQAGKVVHAQWRTFTMRVAPTRAGLLEVAPASDAPADLTLTVTETSALQLAQSALKGDKPPVHIAGDVQFAAEINWLVEHVRWDLEEDLARIVGDAPAHAIGDAARRMRDVMRDFVGRATAMGAPPEAPAAPAAPVPTPPPPATP